MMLISLNSNIPRYFIERFLGPADLGIFAALAYLMVGERMIINALGQAAAPRLSRYYAEGKKGSFGGLLLRLAGLGALVGVPGLLLALLAGRRFLGLVYTPEYARYNGVFILLMAVALLGNMASSLGYGMTAARYFKAQLPLFSLVAVVLVISCLWLIPLYGLGGAAAALGLAIAVQSGGSALIIGHAWRRLGRKTGQGGVT